MAWLKVLLATTLQQSTELINGYLKAESRYHLTIHVGTFMEDLKGGGGREVFSYD